MCNQRMGVFNFQTSPWNQGKRTEAGDQCHMVARCWAIISDNFEDLCFTPFHEKLQKYPDHGHNTNFFFGRNYLTTDWRLAFFRHWRINKWTIPVQIEVDGWSNHWKIRNGDESVSGGTGPWISISFSPRCFQLFGDVWGLCWHNFSRTCICCIFPSFQFWINTFLETWWCFDSCLTAISTQRNYYCDSDEWSFHNSLVPSHLPWRRAARSAMSPICFLDTSQVETMTLQQIMLVSSL